MKIEVDTRPKTDTHAEAVYIRLFPETNQEITELEWAFEVFKQAKCNQVNEPYVKAEVMRIATGGSFHHAITYQKP